MQLHLHYTNELCPGCGMLRAVAVSTDRTDAEARTTADLASREKRTCPTCVLVMQVARLTDRVEALERGARNTNPALKKGD